MTEVSFHFNVPDRTDYTCRLVRKAVRTGAAVVLAGPADAIGRFDRALWSFDDIEFLPHVVLRPDAAVAPRLAPTRVWLAEDARAATCHEVLINLGSAPAPGFESFDRLIEVVSADAADRSAARERWKHYAERGYVITRHEATRAEAAS